MHRLRLMKLEMTMQGVCLAVLCCQCPPCVVCCKLLYCSDAAFALEAMIGTCQEVATMSGSARDYLYASLQQYHALPVAAAVTQNRSVGLAS